MSAFEYNPFGSSAPTVPPAATGSEASQAQPGTHDGVQAGASPASISAAIDQLRNDRIAGKVTGIGFGKEMDRLQALAAGQEPPRDPRSSDELERLAELSLSPPTDELGYGNLGLGTDPEDAALDADVRKAFLAAQVPTAYGRAIAESFARTVERVERMTEQELHAEVATIGGRLRALWGHEYDARIDSVDGLLDDMAAASPHIAEILKNSPLLFAADQQTIDLLARTAEHRARRAAGRR